MEEYLEFYKEKIMESADIEEWENISDILEVLEYKFKKSKYHLENIKQKVKLSTNFGEKDLFETVYTESYYEMESFLISIRSAVDINLHLINVSAELGINERDVLLSTIYHHAKLPNRIKNVLHSFTHNRDNEIWEFIYNSRNEVVHQNSIEELYPLNINMFDINHPVVSITVKNKEKDLVMFFESCLNFLERFNIKLMEAVAYLIERR